MANNANLFGFFINFATSKHFHNMNSITRHISALSISCLTMGAVCSCSSGNEWTINGTVDNAGGNTIVLEASSNGFWYPLDSTEIASSGKFAISQPAAGYPDIYRLRLGEKYVYFPIDSIETVSIKSTADSFDKNYELSGSNEAEMLMYVDKKVADVASAKGIQTIATDSLLKRELSGMLLGDPAGIVSYYIINKRLGGVSVFNTQNKADLRIVGAVANAFNQQRPNDPRTPYLKRLYLGNRASSATQFGSSDTIVANEIPIFEIDLYDNVGNKHLLTDAAKRNKVVVLNFTVYSHESSPAFNVELNKVYERFHNSGMEIYQVSLDADEYEWKQSAKNLPWITVYNSSTDGNSNLINYNVKNLPTTYIISNGEIVERVDDLSKLQSAVAKYM